MPDLTADAQEALRLAEVLEQYNAWRRGGDGEQPDPSKLGKEIEAAAALLRRLSASQGWLPIEQAPKDGSPLMGCTWRPDLPHLYSPRRIFWAAYHPNATGAICWRDAATCGNKLERLTHFRALLAPPSDAQGEQP